MKGYTGVIAGVEFKDGDPVDDGRFATESDARSAVSAIRRYAARRGLVIRDGRLLVPDAEQPEPADPRLHGHTSLGTLRDAAVDPRADDFLPPTNAGRANPHGPDVVSPEVHASQGTRPVKPGPVAVDEPAVQETAETAHAVKHTDVEVERPARNAAKGAWVTYAIAQGADPDEAAAATRADLIDRYGED